MIPWTLDTSAHLAKLLWAFRFSDYSTYVKELEICRNWLDPNMYNFFFNLSKNSIFTKKGYK